MRQELAEAVHGKRTVAAAREAMVAVEIAEDLWNVYTTDEVYMVAVDLSACTCPDAQYRAPDEGCKHVRRVEMRLGERDVPDVRLDPTLKFHTQQGGSA
ncbi:hypothetical protein [Halocalculus aciditolerans]|uniref:SWIM-type domain-containing protein n=1 Tax=Halocalculus aciditolerans TaxID=1383812 RepID=A0A830FHA8_9EURY|nr:hypothetical protein [Halocalculus aciditolerans]GGL55269.1 hypothetical protein GCM10009039_11750 [Halocalculus aciditolerans]